MARPLYEPLNRLVLNGRISSFTFPVFLACLKILPEESSHMLKHEELPPADASVKLITRGLFETLISQARTSPRLRTNYNFHQSFSENPHRFLNAMLHGSYFAPHRHRRPPKPESFIILEGEVAVIIYDEAGNISAIHVLSSNTDKQGIDIAPGIWHTLYVISGYAVCFEVKPGPYDPAEDKEFADWAPREGDDPASVREYQSLLAEAVKKSQ